MTSLLLAKAEKRNSQSSQELLSVFDKKQASVFLELLDKLANSLDAKAGPGTR
ncbi:MAG: hypothetical protein Q8M01_13565 [Rubrivivax sp.]|nr:hypothetical protein [Rubrivivax sp.]